MSGFRLKSGDTRKSINWGPTHHVKFPLWTAMHLIVSSKGGRKAAIEFDDFASSKLHLGGAFCRENHTHTCIFMYTYVCMHACMHACMRMYACMVIPLPIHTHIHIHMHIYYIHIHIYIYMYIYIYICIILYTYACIHIHVCVYIYTHYAWYWLVMYSMMPVLDTYAAIKWPSPHLSCRTWRLTLTAADLPNTLWCQPPMKTHEDLENGWLYMANCD